MLEGRAGNGSIGHAIACMMIDSSADSDGHAGKFVGGYFSPFKEGSSKIVGRLSMECGIYTTASISRGWGGGARV